MKTLISCLLGFAILLSPLAHAQTTVAPSPQITDQEKALERYEELLLQLSVSLDAVGDYKAMEAELGSLFPNREREKKIWKIEEDSKIDPILTSRTDFKKEALAVLMKDYKNLRTTQIQEISRIAASDPATAKE